MKSRLLLLLGAFALSTPVFAAEKASSTPAQPEISVVATVDEFGVPQQVEIERIPSSVSHFAVRHYVKKNLVAVGANAGERIRMQFDAAPVLKQTWEPAKPVMETPRAVPLSGQAGMPPRGMGRGF
jgi:hypothetical protein